MDNQELEDVSIRLREDSDVRDHQAVKADLADRRGVDPDEIANVEAVRQALRAYRGLAQLERDQRMQEVIEHVAEDHNVDPADVSLSCAIKVCAGAYNGYQLTDDWELSEAEA